MSTVGRPRLYPDIQTKWRENKRRYRKAKQTQLKVYHRSLKEDHATPPDYFAVWDTEFHFTLDPCASPENACCPLYFTKEQDGLVQDWRGHTVYMNPPYGRKIGHWMRKAYESAQEGATVVCLIPARTDTRWWHAYVVSKAEVRYLARRLKFGDAKHGATFPSVLVIYRPPC
jgi:phage N-6-adenine-methyltransferase